MCLWEACFFLTSAGLSSCRLCKCLLSSQHLLRPLKGSDERPSWGHLPDTPLLPMQVYQDLCKKHTTFRERSENTDLAVCSLPLLAAALRPLMKQQIFKKPES